MNSRLKSVPAALLFRPLQHLFGEVGGYKASAPGRHDLREQSRAAGALQHCVGRCDQPLHRRAQGTVRLPVDALGEKVIRPRHTVPKQGLSSLSALSQRCPLAAQDVLYQLRPLSRMTGQQFLVLHILLMDDRVGKMPRIAGAVRGKFSETGGKAIRPAQKK